MVKHNPEENCAERAVGRTWLSRRHNRRSSGCWGKDRAGISDFRGVVSGSVRFRDARRRFADSTASSSSSTMRWRRIVLRGPRDVSAGACSIADPQPARRHRQRRTVGDQDRLRVGRARLRQQIAAISWHCCAVGDDEHLRGDRDHSCRPCRTPAAWRPRRRLPADDLAPPVIRGAQPPLTGVARRRGSLGPAGRLPPAPPGLSAVGDGTITARPPATAAPHSSAPRTIGRGAARHRDQRRRSRSIASPVRRRAHR